jgi:hypothetical protein
MQVNLAVKLPKRKQTKPKDPHPLPGKWLNDENPAAAVWEQTSHACGRDNFAVTAKDRQQ